MPGNVFHGDKHKKKTTTTTKKCLSAHQNKAQVLQNRGCLFVIQQHCGLHGHFRVSKMPEKSREHFKQLNTYSRPRLRRRRRRRVSVRDLHECYVECICSFLQNPIGTVSSDISNLVLIHYRNIGKANKHWCIYKLGALWNMGPHVSHCNYLCWLVLVNKPS